MKLVDELIAMSVKAREDLYQAWRKANIVPEFYARLREAASKGWSGIEFEIITEDAGYWEKYARDHDMNFSAVPSKNIGKIWWTVHG